MDEPIIEQIAIWIEGALDGLQDPAGTITLRAVRPNLLDYDANNSRHGDCLIESTGSNTQSATSDSRIERGAWVITGFIRELPTDTSADTMLARMGETIRRLLIGGNTHGRAVGGIAREIDCPIVAYGNVSGAVIVQVTVDVEYETSLHDGYV